MQMNPLRLRTRSHFPHMLIKSTAGMHREILLLSEVLKSFLMLHMKCCYLILLILFSVWVISNDHWMNLNILNPSLLLNECISSRLWVGKELTPTLDICGPCLLYPFSLIMLSDGYLVCMQCYYLYFFFFLLIWCCVVEFKKRKNERIRK